MYFFLLFMNHLNSQTDDWFVNKPMKPWSPNMCCQLISSLMASRGCHCPATTVLFVNTGSTASSHIYIMTIDCFHCSHSKYINATPYQIKWVSKYVFVLAMESSCTFFSTMPRWIYPMLFTKLWNRPINIGGITYCFEGIHITSINHLVLWTTFRNVVFEKKKLVCWLNSIEVCS